MLQEDSNGEFEIVDKKMTSLTTDTGPPINPMLSNLPPPTALPKFVTSPIPQPPISLSGPPRPPFSGPPQPPLNFQPLTTMNTFQPPIPPPGPTAMSPPAPLPPMLPPPQIPIPRPSSVPPLAVDSPVSSTEPTTNSKTTTPVTSQPQSPSSSTSLPMSNVAASDLGGSTTSLPQDQPGWLGWFKGTVSSVGSRVAEKAKTSMDSVITTLDPQMKELIHSGGDIDILVASDKEVKVGGVREAFQGVFGKATVNGLSAQASDVAAQLVGVEAVMKSAEERINNLRSSGSVHPQQPIIAVENFIIEMAPDSWYDLGLLLLDDPWHDIIIQTFTQMTPVPPQYVEQAKQSTPADYMHSSTGFSTTIGQIASQSLQVHHTQWQHSLCGVTRREMIVLAARTLAGLYKIRLPQPQYQAATTPVTPPN